MREATNRSILSLGIGHSIVLDILDAKMCRKPKWFMCSDNRTCIPSTFVCNDIENCPDGDDELNCEGRNAWTPRNCTDSEYTCQDHTCVPLDFMCDGKNDCHDGSDETSGCLRAEHECTGYFCQNRKCLESHLWVCDGVDDCGDASDERGCGKYYAILFHILYFRQRLMNANACNTLYNCPVS